MELASKTKWTIGISILAVLVLMVGLFFAILPPIKSSWFMWWNDVIVPNMDIVSLLFFGAVSFFIATRRWKIWIKVFLISIFLTIASKNAELNLLEALNTLEYQIILVIDAIAILIVFIIKKIKKNKGEKPEEKTAKKQKIVENTVLVSEKKKEEEEIEDVSDFAAVLGLFIILSIGACFGFFGYKFLINNKKVTKIENIFTLSAPDFSKQIKTSKNLFLVSDSGFVGTFPVPKKINVSKVGDKIFISFSSKFIYRVKRKTVDSNCRFWKDDDLILDPRVWTQESLLREAVIFTEKGKIKIPEGTRVSIGHKHKARKLNMSFCVSSSN